MSNEVLITAFIITALIGIRMMYRSISRYVKKSRMMKNKKR